MTSHIPTDYAAALQVSEGLGQVAKRHEARVAAARDGVYPATVAYLEAADALYAVQQRFQRGERVDHLVVSATNEIGRADRDLRACVLRAQAEEKLLEQAQAEHQKAARLAEALLARSAA